MLRNTVLAVVVVLVMGAGLRADEEADKWLKFFVGDWTRTREVSIESEEKTVDTATWSYELAAGGKAAVSKGEWASGTEWIMISGWGPGKIHFERGIDSAGIDWSINYRKVDEYTLRGESIGTVDGEKFNGTVTITRKGDDSYSVTWEAKDATGKLTKAKATNTRVKK